MKRERVIELFEEAQHEAGDMHAVFRFAQMIEQETLEMAAKVCSDMADKAQMDGVYMECIGKDAAHSYGQAQAAKLAELAILALKDSRE